MRAPTMALAVLSVTSPSIAPVVSCANELEVARSPAASARLSVLSVIECNPLRHALSHPVVGLLVGGGEGGESVDVAVVHAERRGDEHGVVDFPVGRSLGARALDVRSGDVLAALLHLTGDREQGLELWRDRRRLRIRRHGVDDGVVAVMMMRRRRAVAGMAKAAIVPG